MPGPAAITESALSDLRILIAQLGEAFRFRILATVGESSEIGEGSLAAAAADFRDKVWMLIGAARDEVSAPGPMANAYRDLGSRSWRAAVHAISMDAAHVGIVYWRRSSADEDLMPVLLAGEMQAAVTDKIEYPLRRLLVTEVYTADVEAHLSDYARDPSVAAIQWATREGACPTCLALEASDLFGLGPGVYPLTTVPAPPHPQCRCVRLPVKGPLEPHEVSFDIKVPAGLTVAAAKRAEAGVRTAIGNAVAPVVTDLPVPIVTVTKTGGG